MKYSIAVYLSLLITNPINAASIEDARAVYNQLVQSNHFTKHVPALKKSNERFANAYYRGDRNTITITKGMLREVRNKSELALLLGHELSHWVYHDKSSKPYLEYRADRNGAKIMTKAGYSVCTGAQLLKRDKSKGGKTHPASQLRYNRLGCK